MDEDDIDRESDNDKITSGQLLSRRSYLKVGSIAALGTGGARATMGKTAAAEQAPFDGSVWTVPGRVAAENFDTGGESVAYHDTTESNDGGYYRDTAVDIQPVDDDTGDYHVGWIRDGEWLEYTVDVTDPDSTYTVQLRVTGKNGAASIDVSLGGEQLGTVDVPDTGGWQDWTTVELTDVSLPSSGEQVLRLDFNGDDFNLNWIDFNATGTGQQPFGGAAWPVPGRVAAEDFDTGGERIAYHDTTDSNDGGHYRDTAVDIQPVDDEAGEYHVGWIRDSEWLEYTVDVIDPDTVYNVQLRVAGKNGSASIDVSLDGESLGTVNVPDTGGWQDWTTVELTDISLPASGEQVLRLEFNGDDFNLNWVDFVDTDTTTNQQPFGGTAWPVPGQVAAEDFDTGGEGVAYHDTTDSNEGGSYRDTAVDIQPVDDDTGEYNVGWIRDSEWLEYTVDVTDPDSTYTIQFRMAGKNGSASVDVSLGGEQLGTVDVPDTGDWQDWTTVELTDITLPSSGEQVLRLDFNGDDFNLNWIDLIDSSTSTNESPAVDSLGLSEVETDNSDAEFDASWAVSDAESNLDSIDLTLTNTDTNEVVDSTSFSVSGESASDTTRLVASGEDGSSDICEVTCTVTDGAENTDSATETATESEPTTSGDYLTWDIIEISFTNSGSYSNTEKYRGLGFEGHFTDGNGNITTVPGFWDGGDTFKLRFTPSTDGEWTWETTADEPSLDGSSGSFTVSSPSSSDISSNANYRGHLQPVVDGHARYIAYADGEPFQYAADTSWDGNSKEFPYDPDFQTWVDDRADKGVTAFQILAGEPSAGYTGDRNVGNNEGGLLFSGSKSNPDYTEINPENLGWFDKRADYIHDSGFVTNIYFEWGSMYDEMSLSEIEDYFRYMCARYGAHNVIWTLCGEFSRSNKYDKMTSSGNYLDSIDELNHIKTIMPGPTQDSVSSTEKFEGDSWIDVHNHQTQGSNEVDLLEQDWSTERPIINAEPHVVNQFEGREEVRTDVWEIFVSGRAAGMGHLYHPIAYDYYTIDTLSDQLDAAETLDVEIGYEFMSTVDWWDLVPADELVLGGSGAATASHTSDGSLELVYFSANDSSTIDLSQVNSSSAELTWLRAVGGERQTEGTFSTGSDPVLSPPSGWDDAVLIAVPA